MSLARFEEDFLSGQRDTRLRFRSMRNYLAALGFRERITGSHHIYSHPRLSEILNLQPIGSACKPYQVRQARKILARHDMRL